MLNSLQARSAYRGFSMRNWFSLTLAILFSVSAFAENLHVSEMGAVYESEFAQTQGTLGDSSDAYVDTFYGTRDILLDIDGLQYPLADGPGDQERPSINGDWLVYQDNASGSFDIKLFNVKDGSRKDVAARGYSEQTPDISGDVVVFISDQYGNDDVWAHSISAGMGISLGTTSTLSESDPSIDGNLVAWQAHDGNSMNIYGAYLGSSYFQITDSSGIERLPKVNGQRVAYMASASGGPSHIEVIDVPTSNIVSVACNVDAAEKIRSVSP